MDGTKLESSFQFGVSTDFLSSYDISPLDVSFIELRIILKGRKERVKLDLLRILSTALVLLSKTRKLYICETIMHNRKTIYELRYMILNWMVMGAELISKFSYGSRVED